MNIRQKDPLTAASPAASAPVRSSQSLTFEKYWRSLPRNGTIPDRSSFKPAQAARFLSQLVLVAVEWSAKPGLRVRLAGTSLEHRIQNKIDGLDYLDMLPPEYHAGAIESTRIMFDRPCGLWQISDLHYQRLFAEPMEHTAFPLAAHGDRPALMISYLVPLNIPVLPCPTAGKAMVIDTASSWAYIEV